MALVASVCSSKGGSGKSTTSLNLGVSLTHFGKDVTLIDANLSTPYLSMYLGAPHAPITLHNLLEGTAHVNQAIYKHSTGIKILPGDISVRDAGHLNLSHLAEHIPKIKSDIIIVDGAPGIDEEAQKAIQLADECLVVTTPELPSVAHSLKTIRLAQRYHRPVTGVVLTRAGHDLDMNIKNIHTILEQPIIGVIPEDKHIKQALYKRQPVVSEFPKAPSSIAYNKLASYLLGHQPHPELYKHGEEIEPVFKFIKWAFGVREY